MAKPSLALIHSFIPYDGYTCDFEAYMFLEKIDKLCELLEIPMTNLSTLYRIIAIRMLDRDYVKHLEIDNDMRRRILMKAMDNLEYLGEEITSIIDMMQEYK